MAAKVTQLVKTCIKELFPLIRRCSIVNYLAHAYLSFNQPDVLVGNLISDFIKGKKQFDYPVNIQTGIRLHRAIDNFTDSHPATKAAADIFRPHYRLYSSAFVDVVYDHFLANDPTAFTGTDLYDFSQEVYSTLDRYVTVFPEAFRRIFPYMKQYNWMYHYRIRDELINPFEGLVRRAAYLTEGRTAFRLFDEHYAELQQHYNVFFPALKEFAFSTLTIMNNQELL